MTIVNLFNGRFNLRKPHSRTKVLRNEDVLLESPQMAEIFPAARGALSVLDQGKVIPAVRIVSDFSKAQIHGSQENKYLFTIDDTGLRVALEKTRFPTVRNCIVHTNLSAEAYVGGEALFVGNNYVIINGGSGRFGPLAGDVDLWKHAIVAWSLVGFDVLPIKLCERTFQPYNPKK